MKIFNCFFLFITLESVKSQTAKEYIDLGDKEYSAQNYKNAIDYHFKVHKYRLIGKCEQLIHNK